MLAVIGRHLPTALRTFLLTLAVVDDLLAIVIIAVFYTAHLSVVPLLAVGIMAGLVLGKPVGITAAVLAAVVLRLRNRTYRRICEEENVDRDGDDIPDVYQR